MRFGVLGPLAVWTDQGVPVTVPGRLVRALLADLLGEALALWRGAALADFADEEFARTAVTRWEELRLTAVEERAEARLDLGEHRELVAELEEQVAVHPYRERLRAAHTRALHRAGRTSEALDGFRELRERLAAELGLDPGPELAELHRAILAGDPAEDAPPRPVRPAADLPAPVTELIGREHAVQRVRDLLAAGRLVTVTGSGGVGKTSVALAAARAAAGYPDGVRLVDLAAWDGTGDPAEVVLSVLAVPDAPGGPDKAGDRLAAALRERRMLLVLDNCEHVVEPVAELVGALLPAAPGLRVLATGREPLRLRGAARWELPPLETADTDDPVRLAGSPAVRLFLARAGLEAEPGLRPRRPWRRCAGGWTASRWRWNWPPPGCPRWAWPSWRTGCASPGTASGCWAPARATPRPGSAPWPR